MPIVSQSHDVVSPIVVRYLADRVISFHPFSPVQVLNYKGLLYCFHIDILRCVRCPCVLAYSTLLLVGPIYSDNEGADTSHDKIQICSLLLWEAGNLASY